MRSFASRRRQARFLLRSSTTKVRSPCKKFAFLAGKAKLLILETDPKPWSYWEQQPSVPYDTENSRTH